MSEQFRDLPHLFVRQPAAKENFTSPNSGRDKLVPLPRNREQHARLLERQIVQAIEKRQQFLAENPDSENGGGFYLEFRLKNSKGIHEAIKSLESRQRKHSIELMAVREDGESLTATVFVPDQRKDYFTKKVEEYRIKDNVSKRDGTSKPRNEKLITQIEAVTYAQVQSLFTDKVNLLPESGKAVWWEAWLIKDVKASFEKFAKNLQLQVGEHSLSFREREVVLVNATLEQMERLISTQRYIAELRLHRETPFTFMEMSPPEQKEWMDDLKARIVHRNKNGVFVCILDRGITRVHPLIVDYLDANNSHSQFSTRGDVNPRGHGTQMAGGCIPD